MDDFYNYVQKKPLSNQVIYYHVNCCQNTLQKMRATGSSGMYQKILQLSFDETRYDYNVQTIKRT